MYDILLLKIKKLLYLLKAAQSEVKKDSKKIRCVLLFLIIIFNNFLYSEKTAVLTGLFNPAGITIDEQHIYIDEEMTIYVYSSENFKFINKFGREGEGPKEFKGFLNIIPQQEHLVINSTGKISFYSKDGKFIKELKTPGVNSIFFPLKNGFIGKSRAFEKNIAYFTVNLYDIELKKRKEIYRVKNFEQPGKSAIFFPIREPKYTTLNNRIIIAGKPGFVIDILDFTGKPLYSIENNNFKPRKFTKEDEAVFREFLKIEYKDRYEKYKQYVHFLDFYPEISFIFTDNNRIYVSTWRISNNKVELFEYDINGELLNIFFVPIVWQSVLKPYLLSIKNRKIYQLIENQDEQWELHVSPLIN